MCSDLQPVDRAIVPAPPVHCDDFTIPLDKVESILMKSKTNKSPGPDNLPNWILHDLAPYIAPPICSILTWMWMINSIKDKLDPDQFGGMPGLSATHVLIDLLHHWYTAADDKLTTNILLLDYSKAYDHIDHNVVIQKLIDLGVP